MAMVSGTTTPSGVRMVGAVLPGKEVAQEGGQFVGVKPGAVQFDRQVKRIEQEPAAQGPRRIGAVSDHKVIGHGCHRSHLRLPQASMPIPSGKAQICAQGHHGM
jgi:hypothetical protein